jgi:hypothetical protein
MTPFSIQIKCYNVNNRWRIISNCDIDTNEDNKYNIQYLLSLLIDRMLDDQYLNNDFKIRGEFDSENFILYVYECLKNNEELLTHDEFQFLIDGLYKYEFIVNRIQ